ncbi:MAG: M1 family metallopeptidase [Bacteroidetes bacterium]|nr:M1 family metallopeptidase [Bacteroidota bacterium]
MCYLYKFNYFYHNKIYRLLIVCLFLNTLKSQNIFNNPKSNHGNRFEQLGTILPTPNEYRTASGAPGNKYWQQKANYDINVSIDEANLKVIGTETITYINNSPDALDYLWLQLDENEHDPKSDNNYFDENRVYSPLTDQQIHTLTKEHLQELGDKIDAVTDDKGKKLPYTINQTMMRIDLPNKLAPKGIYKFVINWHYKMIERTRYGGRGGYELFADDGNYLFTLTQWYPRMCVYSDFHGWQNKQFTGRGEFALTFGNFKVKITVPADYIVCSTGLCQNYQQVLSQAQFTRWQNAQSAKEPIEIVTLDEAKKAEQNKSAKTTKTWIFKADSVRDFAWGASKKFIWDAMPTLCDGKKVMCMSFYPKEAYGLYRKYSTKVVAHTIKTYSKYTIPYPYPVAQSIEAANGMEYPMICFNFGRTEKDGTYSEGTKNGMLLVIIHEVGHNFFPMIINSDERQWSWMDEGLNTFVQFLTEQEFDVNFPSSRGPAHKIVDYMRLPKNYLEPIMVNSENIINFGANAYGKPATALTILRETVMGRELFDYAFKQYSKRWAFKHPEPADFFRTMEDASAVDLDWFWRAWFFDTEPVDISIDTVKAFTITKGEKVPVKNDTVYTYPKQTEFNYITQINNKKNGIIPLVDKDTLLRDFYYHYKPEQIITKEVKNKFDGIEQIPDNEIKSYEGNFIYEIKFSNRGGCVMPLIIKFNYADGTNDIERINAYVWRKDEQQVIKTFLKSKKVVSIQLDPYKETADINENNNLWNIKPEPSKFEIFKAKQGAARGQSTGQNPMQKSKMNK